LKKRQACTGFEKGLCEKRKTMGIVYELKFKAGERGVRKRGVGGEKGGVESGGKSQKRTLKTIG